MEPVDPSTTLADLVTARPGVAAHLDRLGLDYCCGGQRSVGAAIVEAGLELHATLAVLSEAPAEPAPETWTGMDGLVDHLETTHHGYLREALPRLVALADKVAGVHGANHAELHTVAALVRELEADLVPHLAKEEEVLFPMIRTLAAAKDAPTFHCGSLANPIRVMLLEHDDVGDLLARVRAETVAYRVPDDGCASYAALYRGLEELEADTHQHVHKENNLLFPMVLETERMLETLAR